MKNYKWLLILPLLTLFASCEKKVPPRKKLPIVQTTYPIKKEVPIYIDVPGHIEPIQKVDIQPQVNGEVMAIHYEEGSYVEKGTPLVTIDNRPYLATKYKYEGELAQNQAKLQYAKDTTIRNEPLAQEDFISQNTFDQLVTNMESLEGTILANLAEIQSAQINIDFCDIAAPISGILGNRKIDMGNIVTAYSNQTLVTIKQVAPIWASFGIDESYLFDIQKQWTEHPVEVVVYNDTPNKPIASGKLVFIDNHINERTGQVLMKGHFENKEKTIWPGQYVKVRLIKKMEKEAILIPSEAVQNGQNGHYVYTINDSGIAEMKTITLGLAQENGKYLMVLKGLSTHDQIVVNGQINIKPGIKVKIENKKLPSKYQSTEQKIS
ncbi:MAG: efflux RND transporter periplasmic adaptor subunit [Rhabdochlamydiaceae bacterium]|nr:efflux RND transporter periplasmic adaptor subunit [Candidatus Amphrikana amoebophyrae]